VWPRCAGATWEVDPKESVARHLVPQKRGEGEVMEKSEKVWLDGELVAWDDANVHVLTHSLHYGLSLFEGIRAYERADGRTQIFRLREHIRRLLDGGKIATIDIPFGEEELVEACVSLVRVNGLRSCYIRPLAFLGDGAMGLYATSNPVRVVIVAWPWGAYLGDKGLRDGIRAKVSSFTRHHVNTSMVKAKIGGQYVNSILAKREVVKAGYDEALLLDTNGYVCEASGENIFAVKNGVLFTPSTGSSLLNGLTRDTILRLAADFGISVQQQRFTRDELYIADEVFLTGTAAEITPVREIDDRQIGSGSRGPLTQRFQEAYFDIVKGSDTRHEEWLHWVDFG